MSASKTKKTNKVELESKVTTEKSESLDPILIVHGASTTKVGYGGEKYPRFVIPRQSTVLTERIKRFPLTGSEPVNEDWLKAYWEAIVAKLNVNLSERKILLSLPTANISDCPFRETAFNFFYEKLGAYKIAAISDPFLSLVSYLPQIKKLDGIMVDIGFSQIRIVPIFHAAILEDHIAQFSFGGFDLTKTLGGWLQNKGYEGPIDALFLRDIKENFCFVRPFKQAINKGEEESFTYTLENQKFPLESELWKLPELFFYKNYFSSKKVTCPRSDSEGEKYDHKSLTLPKAIGYVIKSLNQRLWDTMAGNICLIGGGTKFRGLHERIDEELKYLFPELKKKIQIHSLTNTDLCSYIGASKLSKVPSFQKYWLSSENYSTGIFELFL